MTGAAGKFGAAGEDRLGGAAEGEWIGGEAPGRCLFRSVWLGTCPLLLRFDRFPV